MSSDVTILERCNETELQQLCERAGLRPHPASSKEQLIAFLIGEKEPSSEVHPIDRWRDEIMGFILEHWTVLEAQLTCPAKSKDPKSCYQCCDAQVMNCLVENKTHLMQIRRSR